MTIYTDPTQSSSQSWLNQHCQVRISHWQKHPFKQSIILYPFRSGQCKHLWLPKIGHFSYLPCILWAVLSKASLLNIKIIIPSSSLNSTCPGFRFLGVPIQNFPQMLLFLSLVQYPLLPSSYMRMHHASTGGVTDLTVWLGYPQHWPKKLGICTPPCILIHLCKWLKIGQFNIERGGRSPLDATTQRIIKDPLANTIRAPSNKDISGYEKAVKHDDAK
eukprot:5545640-Ditylum_brightwellii.AAC.3